MRWCGIKGNRILVISDRSFERNDLIVIPVPASLNEISSKDLLINYRHQDGSFISKDEKTFAKDVRLAVITNFHSRCGLSTYMEELLPHLLPKFKSFKLFVEKNSAPTAPMNEIGGIVFDGQIEECWKRGESLSVLVDKVKEFAPSIIIINHEFGIFPNARYFLAMLTQLSDFRIIVVEHSVFRHADKSIVENAMPEIVVHLEGAKKVLKEEKKVLGKVYVVPHGSYKKVEGKLWNQYGSHHTVLQFGFGLKYKNFEHTVRSIALLKDKYKDIFLTILFSESPHCRYEHQVYYDELIELIASLNLKENVSIIRGFLSDEGIDSYFRTNAVAVFPYKNDKENGVFGSSGASRLAMSKCIPVITSDGEHFSDLPSIKTSSEKETADAIDNLFSNKLVVEEQLKRQSDYMERTSWSIIADKYISLIES